MEQEYLRDGHKKETGATHVVITVSHRNTTVSVEGVKELYLYLYKKENI